MKNFQNFTKNLGAATWRKTLLLLLLVCYQSVIAQVVRTDSVEIHQSWKDKNGENKLVVNVNALCNPDRPPFDGRQTKIIASLKNKKFTQEIVFDDKDYQMEMILFREKDVWFSEYNGVKAVFVPFFYCGNADNDIKASFIIFYNNKKYLYHLKFYCSDEGDCRLNEKNINLKLKELSKEMRDDFIKKIKTKYIKISQFAG